MSENEFSSSGPGYVPAAQTTNISFGNPENATAPSSAPVRDISTAEFMPLVIEASAQVPVLVDFWAPWCEPCKQLTPIIEKVVAEAGGRVNLVKMNIEEHPEVAGQMGIQSIPAVVAFVDGKPADAFMGVKTESEIRAFVEKVAGPPAQDQGTLMLEEAQRLEEEGALSEAANLYGAILQSEPDNLKALSGLGHLYMKDGKFDAAKGLVVALNEEQLASPDIASLKTAIELSEQAEAVGDFSELQKDVDANPANHQARYDLAIALNAANQREEAADQLLEIITAQPGWNEDAARIQLLQFFEAWGMTDNVTNTARRKLSSILFS